MLAITLLSLLPGILAANTFVGCVTTFPDTSFAYSNTASPSSCADVCEFFGKNAFGNGAKVYSNHKAAVVNESNCYCTTTFPGADSVQDSQSGHSDTCVSSDHWSVYRTGTSFVFDQCYSGNPSGAILQATSIDECFTYCKTKTSLSIAARSSSFDTSFRCYCEDQQSTPSICSKSNFYHYGHPISAAVSGLARRRKSRVINARDYCPAGLTACMVQGADGYECLDVSTELESCGGCVWGQYGSLQNTTQGVNCAKDGEFGTTCRAGQCVEEF